MPEALTQYHIEAYRRVLGQQPPGFYLARRKDAMLILSTLGGELFRFEDKLAAIMYHFRLRDREVIDLVNVECNYNPYEKPYRVSVWNTHETLVTFTKKHLYELDSIGTVEWKALSENRLIVPFADRPFVRFRDAEATSLMPSLEHPGSTMRGVAMARYLAEYRHHFAVNPRSIEPPKQAYIGIDPCSPFSTGPGFHSISVSNCSFVCDPIPAVSLEFKERMRKAISGSVAFGVLSFGDAEQARQLLHLGK